MDIVIRELHGPDLTKGFLDVLTNLAEVGVTTNKAAEILRTRLRNNERTFIARVGEQIAGTASLMVERKFIHHGGFVGHVEDVAVHRDYEGKGIGSALIHHIIEEAKKAGCYKVILSCFDDRIPFYERLGFRRYEVGMRLDLKADASKSDGTT